MLSSRCSVAAASVGAPEALASVKPRSGGALRDLERALEGLGDVTTFHFALNETVEQGRDLVRMNRGRRADNLNAAVASFLRESGRDAQFATAAGWRVVALSLYRGRRWVARALYNREPLTSWLPAQQPAESGRHSKMRKVCSTKSAIPNDVLASSFLEAYEYLAARREGMDVVSRRVVLRELLEEVLDRAGAAPRSMVESARKLRGQLRCRCGPCFYNAYRYRSAAAGLPTHRRLMLRREGTRDRPNRGDPEGLDAAREYERFCYVRRAADS